MNIERLLALASVPVWAVDERALGAALHAESLAERKARGLLQVAHGVALVPVEGVLAPKTTTWGAFFGGEITVDEVRAMLRAALADDQVSSLVLVIDSPGGDVSGVPELADELYALRGQKPVVAHVRYLAASGAYWLASQADAITVEPSGEVGSIGVFTLHQSYAAALEKTGIETTLIRAGRFKAEWNPYQPLTEDAKAHAQGQVDEVDEQFIKAVARGRGVTPSVVRDTYGEGRTLLAKDAKAAGMVDRIETLEETILRASAGRRGARRAEDEDALARTIAACEAHNRDLDYLRL